jgi:hypothetical protein
MSGRWFLYGRPRNAAEVKARGMRGRSLTPLEIAAEAEKLGLPVCGNGVARNEARPREGSGGDGLNLPPSHLA